ncbi:3554_t:CDS:2, partial [Funneliformis geosporum]
MALVAPVVASFEWTIEVARELIRLRRENHDDFEFGSPLLPLNVVGNGTHYNMSTKSQE